MFEHRLTFPISYKVFNFDPPFSSFNYIENEFLHENLAIRRLFSLARAQSAKTLVSEIIEPEGIIEDENYEILRYYPDYQMTELRRISFWKSYFDETEIDNIKQDDFLGYAILKKDRSASINYERWHVFEAVISKYPDKHNCVPNPYEYQVLIHSNVFTIKGLLYAQQNGLNKKCAQVALRSVISRISQREISYREVNQYARDLDPKDFDISRGLSAQQIQAVLHGYGIPFRDIDYEDETDVRKRSKIRRKYPYQKYVYSGIESGAGALVGFKLSGPAITREYRHIIPFYGHTFNKDTWAPEADKSYFKVGEKVGYLPSENWTSSFLGHDDNFGPNFCIPRLYISAKQVEYVVELLNPGVVFNGSQAEALALQFLYSVLRNIDLTTNIWNQRLGYYAGRSIQRIVLRAVALNREQYIEHLTGRSDWEGKQERGNPIINIFKRSLPQQLWVVEVSIPELFPANERKLGEIILNGERRINQNRKDRSNFVFARLPGVYLLDLAPTATKPKFLSYPSNIISHFPLVSLND